MNEGFNDQLWTPEQLLGPLDGESQQLLDDLMKRYKSLGSDGHLHLRTGRVYGSIPVRNISPQDELRLQKVISHHLLDLASERQLKEALNHESATPVENLKDLQSLDLFLSKRATNYVKEIRTAQEIDRVRVTIEDKRVQSDELPRSSGHEEGLIFHEGSLPRR